METSLYINMAAVILFVSAPLITTKFIKGRVGTVLGLLPFLAYTYYKIFGGNGINIETSLFFGMFAIALVIEGAVASVGAHTKKREYTQFAVAIAVIWGTFFLLVGGTLL